MRTADLDYHLPPELIATRPVEPRDSARLLVVRRSSDNLTHAHICDLPDFLHRDDTLILNTTTVLPARIYALREDTSRHVEGLFIQAIAADHWRCLLRGRLKPGHTLRLLDQSNQPSRWTLRLLDRDAEAWIVAVEPPGQPASILDRCGQTPLPPYILRARGESDIADALDRAWYQTVYADPTAAGSVAAPTAGLHFTPQLLERLAAMGVKRANVILDVGMGTFKPVETETLAEHPMHEEHFVVPEATVNLLRVACDSDAWSDVQNEPDSPHTPVRQRRTLHDRRLIAVGTTTVRALGSLPASLPPHGPYAGSTRLLISPGFPFRFTDGLLTNFHLPRSTLLALVASLVGLERLKGIYAEAVARRYRFYSYGDAMLILP